MNCNSCLKINPLPECIDTEEFQLFGLTFPDYLGQTIVAIFRDVATNKKHYFNLEIDGSGEIASFDVASLFPLENHTFEISFVTQSSGSPANFTLTNEDLTTREGCCLEFNVNVGMTGSDGFFLSTLECAAEDITPVNASNYMLKADYDPDDDGCVTCAETLEGESLADVSNRSNHTGTQGIETITDLQSALDDKVDDSQLGVDVATLTGGILTLSQRPPGTPNQYQGLYDASTNTPAIINGTGTAGDFYIADVIGNAYAPVNVTLENQIVVYSGTVWEVGPVFTGGIAQITTDAGVQVGPSPTINTTAHMAPVGDRLYVTADEKAGIAASPNPVTAANPVATQADLTAIEVGSSFFMAELFSNGETLGDGTSRTLASLGYSDPEAAGIWPLCNSNYSIDVNTWTIDKISYREACLTMQEQMYSALISPGGRGYIFDDTVFLPREQDSWTGNRRGLMFDFDFKGSAFRNLSGNSWICFDRYPVNQTEANSNFLDFKYNMRNAFWVGNDTADEDDCFIRIGASVGSYFDSIKGENCGIVIDAQFCLQVGFKDIFTVAYGIYGIACRDGLWTGAGANTAQSNNARFEGCHHYHGSGKSAFAAMYIQGNRNVNIYSCQFEGFSGAEHHIYYNQSYPTSGTLVTTVKNLVYMESLDFENAGASRAGIRIIGNNASAELNRFNTQVDPADMAVLCELQKYNAVNGDMTFFIRNANNYNPGYKFRDVRNGGGTNSYVVEYVMLNNNTALDHADNWDLTNGGSIPTRFNYTAII